MTRAMPEEERQTRITQTGRSTWPANNQANARQVYGLETAPATKPQSESNGHQTNVDNFKTLTEIPTEPWVVVKSGNVKEMQTAGNVSTELMRIKAVWPFDFFPSELIIEEHRLVINQRTFFLNNIIDTIPISAILNFEVSNSPFFSTIYLKGGEMGSIEITIKWFNTSDARKAKEVVDGLYMREKGMVEVIEPDPAKKLELFRNIGKTRVTS